MRKIKFRAWDKERRVMTEPFGLKDFDGDYFIPDGVMLNDENSEIMQYTGLKDKNGKEIYEGDIIKFTRVGKYETITEVYFSVGMFTTRDKDGDMFGGLSLWNNECEIIGNIYENSELLKRTIEMNTELYWYIALAIPITLLLILLIINLIRIM